MSELAGLAAGQARRAEPLTSPSREAERSLWSQGYGYPVILTRSVLAFGSAPHAASGAALDTTSSKNLGIFTHASFRALTGPAKIAHI